MSEKIFVINEVDPIDLYGINDKKLEQIKKHFPSLKMIARGDELKVIGHSKTITAFELKLQLLIQHLLKYKQLNENNIWQVLEESNQTGTENLSYDHEVILYGNSGIIVKARTANQRKLVQSIKNNDMVFAIGPAGTGKTYTAVAMAVKAFKEKQVKRIILTRPAVEAGENLGFLPGDVKDKLDPYLQPLYDALRDMLPADKLNDLIANGFIQIAPLAFMRGRTLDQAFVILDEAQNATESQFKMFLTRMGQSAKFLITGDITQVDLPKHSPSGLIHSIKILKNIAGIDFIYFDEKDVIRHHLVKDIILAYQKNNKK
ncbi:MAG: PhoH family protein [Bacteroidetes bacterium]|nr:PhoH family protein [Bacteroidota bacterium]MCL4815562.1 PhoH family protein [Flavobacteriales bacterium]NOG94300.1 PhoH family protein [Bacteroidota bacterium]WKZ76617.1 MAG: PhoH family protein [Vicingaceae bacterium]